MKSKISIIILSITAILLFIFIIESCAKKIGGCMDTNATNFNINANENNGTCQYQGKVVFWWNQAFADSCSHAGVDSVKIYTRGILQCATSVPTQSWSSAPDCGSASVLAFSIPLGENTSENVTIQAILISHGGTTWSTVNYNPLVAFNSCQSFQLLWK
jgi:hypothetical protein